MFECSFDEILEKIGFESESVPVPRCGRRREPVSPVAVIDRFVLG